VWFVLFFSRPFSRVASRKELSLWVCEQHNLVNKKLNKPLFKCDLVGHKITSSSSGGGGGVVVVEAVVVVVVVVH